MCGGLPGPIENLDLDGQEHAQVAQGQFGGPAEAGREFPGAIARHADEGREVSIAYFYETLPLHGQMAYLPTLGCVSWNPTDAL